VRTAPLALMLAAVAAVAACSDPTLSVTIDLPAAYRSMVTSISLADYERAGLTCDAIAYGDESAQALEGALTTQVEVSPGASAGLTGISRLDHKVLVARGRDAAGDLVVAGCRDLDALDGDVAIDLPTAPAAIVTVDPRRPDVALDPAAPIAVHVLDPLGQPLEQRSVVWRVFGPRAQPGGVPGDGACPRAGVDGCALTSGGNAFVAAAPPAQPGPALVEIHVAWARAQPAPVASFQSPASATFLTRAAKPVPFPSCVAYRAASGTQVACLGVALGGTTEVQRFAWNGAAVAKVPGSTSVANAAALVAVPGGASDKLIAITEGGDFVDGATGQTLGHAPVGASTVVAAQLVPPCGKSSFVVLGLADGSVVTTDTTGAALSTFVGSPASRVFSLAASGCISDLATPATQYRGVILLETKNNTSVPYAQIDCPGKPCMPTWVGLGEGVGFVSAAGGESRLATGRLDLSGVVIDESRLDPGRPPEAQLASMATHDAITVPAAIASGDLDGDGAADRAWLVLTGGARPQGRLQVELAATTGDGVPIAGISPELGAQPVGIVIARVDDDAIDDVIIYSADVTLIVLTGRSP
jgi:hypothetical protein